MAFDWVLLVDRQGKQVYKASTTAGGINRGAGLTGRRSTCMPDGFLLASNRANPHVVDDPLEGMEARMRAALGASGHPHRSGEPTRPRLTPQQPGPNRGQRRVARSAEFQVEFVGSRQRADREGALTRRAETAEASLNAERSLRLRAERDRDLLRDGQRQNQARLAHEAQARQEAEVRATDAMRTADLSISAAKAAERRATAAVRTALNSTNRLHDLRAEVKSVRAEAAVSLQATNERHAMTLASLTASERRIEELEAKLAAALAAKAPPKKTRTRKSKAKSAVKPSVRKAAKKRSPVAKAALSVAKPTRRSKARRSATSRRDSARVATAPSKGGKLGAKSDGARQTTAA